MVVVRERRDESWAGQASAIGSKGEREGANVTLTLVPTTDKHK